jgi:hypothetical protein
MWYISIYIKSIKKSKPLKFTVMQTFIYSVRNNKNEEAQNFEILAFDQKNALDRALALHQGKRIKIKGLK